MSQLDPVGYHTHNWYNYIIHHVHAQPDIAICSYIRGYTSILASYLSENTAHIPLFSYHSITANPTLVIL